MNEYEIPKLVRQIVREEMAPLLMGKITSTQSAQRATAQRFSGESPIANQRILSPYGLSSRPKAGTGAMIAPVQGDATHLNVLTCFDETRPDVDDGEALLYGADGQVIFLKTGGTIHQGSKAADEPVVLGNVAMTFLGALLDLLINSDPLAYDSFGLDVVLNPEIIEQLTEFKNTYITTAATNIVGQKNFVERGA